MIGWVLEVVKTRNEWLLRECLPLLMQLPWLLVSGCLGLMPTPSQAGSLSCAIASVSGISLNYAPASSTALVGSGSITINCSKSGSNSDTRYLEIGAGSGMNASGTQNRAAGPGAFLGYGLRRDAALVAPWSDVSGSRLTSTVTATTATTTSVTLNWWIVVPAGQSVPAGTYLDTVTLRLYQDANPNPSLVDLNPGTATASISLNVTSVCSLSSAPANLNFSYTSFQTVASAASSSFAVTCTQGAPYTVALDATSGTLLGLSYQLSLSVSGPQVGTGTARAMSVNGTMAAGQSGTCSAATCSASNLRTITISY